MSRLRDEKNRQVRKRKNKAITRTEFYYRYGPQQKRWLMQQLMLEVPWFGEEALAHLRTIKDNIQSLVAECIKYNLLGDKLDEGLECLEDALRRGLSRQRLIDFANILKDYNKLTSEQEKEFFEKYNQMNLTNDAMDLDIESGDENELGSEDELFVRPKIPVNALVTYENNFTDTQRKVYKYIVERIENNIQILLCVCGEAGVGKTFLINALVAYFQEKQPQLNFVLLASTGVAATNINGSTAFRFLRMDLTRKCGISYRTIEAKEVSETDVIIFDEVSMVDPWFFEDMRYLLRKFCRRRFREGNWEFGGKHMIFFGDFAQLPAIGSQLWQSEHFGPKFKFAVLRQIVRQTDVRFQRILSKLRLLDYDSEVLDFINDRAKGFEGLVTFEQQIFKFIGDRNKSKNPKDYEGLTILVSRRSQRDLYNNQILDHLLGNVYINKHCLDERERRQVGEDQLPDGILAIDTCHSKDHRPKPAQIAYFKDLKKGLVECLRLKIGAKVLLTRNYNTERGWVNGTLARVKSITDEIVVISKINDDSDQFCVFRETQKSVRGGFTMSRTQFPLELSYSLTVHKCQGLTLQQDVYVVLDKVFKPAQPYVAFSRCVAPGNLHILNKNSIDFRAMSENKSKLNLPSVYRTRLLLQWIDDVDIIGKNKPFGFPEELLQAYVFINPEDRQGDAKYVPEPDSDSADDIDESDIDLKDFKPYNIYSGSTECVSDKESLGGDEEIHDFGLDSEVDDENVTISNFDFMEDKVKPFSTSPTKRKINSQECSDSPRNKLSKAVQNLNITHLSSEQENWAELNQSAHNYLKQLIERGAYTGTMTRFTTEFFNGEIRCFAEEMSNIIRNLEPKIFEEWNAINVYSGEQPLFRRFGIESSDFRLMKTTGDGSCFYHSISQSLTGSENLSYILRLLTVLEFVRYHESNGNTEDQVYRMAEQMYNPNGRSVDLRLIDSTFTAGAIDFIDRDLFPNRIRNVVEAGTINWSTFIHLYMMSGVLNRPVLQYGGGIVDGRAQAIFYTNCRYRDSVEVFMDNEGRHYMCMLPCRNDVLNHTRFYVWGRPWDATEQVALNEDLIDNRPPYMIDYGDISPMID